MSGTNSNPSLSATISQFTTDAGLVHQFANGSATTVVESAGGSYPSLAKFIADAQTQVNTVIQNLGGGNNPNPNPGNNESTNLAGVVVRSYRFVNETTLQIEHVFNTDNVFVSIINTDDGAVVTAPFKAVTNSLVEVYFSPQHPETGIANVTFYLDI